LFFDVGAQRAVPLYLGHGSPCPYEEITLGNPYIFTENRKPKTV